jgi:transcriptional regulator with XRE-family HTH domain
MGAQHKNIVGPQIRRLRVAAGLSQAALAAVCQRVGWDIDRNTIAKIEGQMRWVGDFELGYLAKVFKCQLGDLFSGEK